MERKPRSAAFKKKIALEAVKEHKTISQIASDYGVHPMQVGKWKKELIDGCEAVFEDKRSRKKRETEEQAVLERKIGQLTVELDYVKKKLGY